MSAAYSETLRPVERKAKFLYYGASQMVKYRLFSDPRQRSFSLRAKTLRKMMQTRNT